MPGVHVQMIEIEEKKRDKFGNNSVFLHGFLQKPNKKKFQRSHEASLPSCSYFFNRIFVGVGFSILGVEAPWNWGKCRGEEERWKKKGLSRRPDVVGRYGDDDDGGDLFCG